MLNRRQGGRGAGVSSRLRAGDKEAAASRGWGGPWPSLCALLAPPGDLTAGQKRALSSQRRLLGIRLGTKPLPGGEQVSGWPPSPHKLGGLRWGRGWRLQLAPRVGGYPLAVQTHSRAQPPPHTGYTGLPPPSLIHSFLTWSLALVLGTQTTCWMKGLAGCVWTGALVWSPGQAGAQGPAAAGP